MNSESLQDRKFFGDYVTREQVILHMKMPYTLLLSLEHHGWVWQKCTISTHLPCFNWNIVPGRKFKHNMFLAAAR